MKKYEIGDAEQLNEGGFAAAVHTADSGFLTGPDGKFHVFEDCFFIIVGE